MLKDLIKVIQQEQRSYKDPVTEFLECLYVNYDFDGAQQKLMECDQVSLVLFLPNMTVVFIELHMYLLWMFKSLNGNVLHFTFIGKILLCSVSYLLMLLFFIFFCLLAKIVIFSQDKVYLLHLEGRII